MERREVWITHPNSRLGVMVETEGEDWKDPLKLFFFFFSLCSIYQ